MPVLAGGLTFAAVASLIPIVILRESKTPKRSSGQFGLGDGLYANSFSNCARPMGPSIRAFVWKDFVLKLAPRRFFAASRAVSQ